MTAQELYLDTPLYSSLSIPDLDELRKLTHGHYCDPFDGYNPIDRIETTFRIKANWDFKYESGKDLYIKVEINCSRTNSYFVFHLFWDASEKTLMKIGQFPSVAHFHISKIKEYDKIFKKENLKEFSKAIGLAAHGVGIGSFVYLRRIFETLIFEAAAEMEAKNELNREEFSALRMGEKIGYLKSYLPNFLVEHKDLYSILSLGIHELSDEVCLEYFDTVKVGIEFILDERLEKHEKLKKIQLASAKIKNVSKELKSGN